MIPTIRSKGTAACAVGAGVAALVCACAGLSAQTGTLLPDVQWSDPGAEAREPSMRVLLVRGVEAVHLGGPASLRVGVGDELRRVRTPLEVQRRAGAWAIAGGSGEAIEVDGDAALAIESDGAEITLEDRRLPGTLRLHASGGDSSAIDVVEHLPIETYLPGVIARELVASWSPTAFEVQAICARSYALHERRRQRGLGSHYDVEGTTQDQVYHGQTFNSRAHRAVRATRGRVLTYNGRVLRAYYSSTCGGRAASARDTWPTTDGYEFNLLSPIQASTRPDACTISPLHRWDVQREVADAVARINAWMRVNPVQSEDLDGLRSIEVVSRNAFGRPRLYRVTDAKGRSVELQAEAIRSALNFAGAPGLSPPNRARRVHSADFSASVRDGVLRLEGRGFGHGVGMCQYGVEGLARRGATVGEILAIYYPQAEVERLYR